jgi:hypothetical protein
MKRAPVPPIVAVVVLAVVVPSAAAQVPTQDSVTGSGVVLGGSNATFTFEIDAHSGPSGENPTGQVTFRSTTDSSLFFTGPVTCLSVNANVGTLTVATQQFDDLGVEITDSPSGDLIRAAPTGMSGCESLVFGLDLPVISGDVVVIDAPQLPTANDQCKNRGWRTYGVFKNQGDCVSFVATGGRNQPSGH